MLRSPSARVATFALACSVSVLCSQAQTAAPADQGPAQTAPGASSPQLTIRTNNKTNSAVPADSQNAPEAQKYIAREFGPGFLLAEKMPVLLGDLDGDGTEDAVFIVTGGNPLVSAGAFNFNVLDPYDGFWSFADPTLNTQMRQTEPGPHYCVLVAHDWRGEKAKAKYVLINLPFKQISLIPTTMGSGRLVRKKDKKIVAAIATIERDGQTGAVFWNGRTYKFVQLGNVDD
jgi:hypothetical protein